MPSPIKFSSEKLFVHCCSVAMVKGIVEPEFRLVEGCSLLVNSAGASGFTVAFSTTGNGKGGGGSCNTENLHQRR